MTFKTITLVLISRPVGERLIYFDGHEGRGSVRAVEGSGMGFPAQRWGMSAAGRRPHAEPLAAGGPIRRGCGLARRPRPEDRCRDYSSSSGAPWTSRGWR